ncbi:MAG: hypothetical protein ACKVQC_02610 [Elusimicrobiota bacterium]
MASKGTSPMNCPSCGYKNAEGLQYCVRCRMSFHALSLVVSRFRDHFYWIFRRSGAGFISGLVAWFFIPALSRVISEALPVWLFFSLQGILGGAFLGTIDGMSEESTPKTMLGALLGGIGGAIGGGLFGYLSPGLNPSQTVWGIFFFWAFTGACIGIVSALWEKKTHKLIAGALSGFVGGGVGGALGYAVYAYLIQEFSPQSWFLIRLSEGFYGGIIGLTLWFSVGAAEKFIIFKRKHVGDKTYKLCHSCQTHNPLQSWYCGKCGSVLQEFASAASLHLTPFTTLDRLKDFFRFLSRLASTTGIIGGVVVFLALLPVHKILALVAFILVSVASYAALVVFSSLAESIQLVINRKI